LSPVCLFHREFVDSKIGPVILIKSSGTFKLFLSDIQYDDGLGVIIGISFALKCFVRDGKILFPTSNKPPYVTAT